MGVTLAREDIHPRPGAVDSNTTEFARVAAAIDEAEAVAWDRIGGPNRADIDTVQSLERRLAHLRPVNLHDVQWLARRLARAAKNGWHGGPLKMLVKLAV